MNNSMIRLPKKYRLLLAEKGFCIGKPLGKGHHGRVYKITDELVLKLTIRETEAQIYSWLLQNPMDVPALPQIFAVWSGSNTMGKPFFLIVRENLNDFRFNDAAKFHFATAGLENRFYANAGEHYWRYGLNQAKQKIDPRDTENLEEMAGTYEVLATTPIRVYDCHEENLGLRQDGTLVIRDMSSGRLISDIPDIPGLSIEY